MARRRFEIGQEVHRVSEKADVFGTVRSVYEEEISVEFENGELDALHPHELRLVTPLERRLRQQRDELHESYMKLHDTKQIYALFVHDLCELLGIPQTAALAPLFRTLTGAIRLLQTRKDDHASD